MQYCKVEIRNSAKPCYFPYKIVRNCAMTNVPTIALLIPQLRCRVLKGWNVKYREILVWIALLNWWSEARKWLFSGETLQPPAISVSSLV